MRDPNRIDQVLSEIGIIWKEHPDLRLGQIISNVLDIKPLYVENNIEGFISKIDPFYLEDYQFLNIIKQWNKKN